MNPLSLAYKNLVKRPLKSSLSLLLMAFGVALISLIFNVNTQLKDQFSKNLGEVDLVIGAKGSPLQIILSSIFHIDFPTGNILEKDTEWLKRNRLVKNTAGISLGDSYKNYRIMGCDSSLFNFYELNIAEGSFPQDEMEVLIGSSVASKLGLQMLDTFSSAHGLEDNDIMDHDDHPFTVIGILEENGTVMDRLILCSNETYGHVHGKESAEKEITALFLQFRNPLAAVQLPRQINSRSNLQAASPAFESARLFTLLKQGIDIISYIAIGIMVMAAMSIFISLFLAIKERRFELALLRSMGAGRLYVFLMVLFEAMILTSLGYLLGIMLSHGGIYAYGLFNNSEEKYILDEFYWVGEESILLIVALIIALFAGIIPAIQAYRTEISETLSNANS